MTIPRCRGNEILRTRRRPRLVRVADHLRGGRAVADDVLAYAHRAVLLLDYQRLVSTPAPGRGQRDLRIETLGQYQERLECAERLGREEFRLRVGRLRYINSE